MKEATLTPEGFIMVLILFKPIAGIAADLPAR